MRAIWVCVGSAVALLAVPAQAHECRLSQQEIANIDRTVRSVYDALTKDDRAAFDQAVAPDFFAFELGKTFSGDELFRLIADAHKSGRVINWSLRKLTIRGNCEVAWAAWENIGSAGVPPKLELRRWMESAALHRTASGWRVEFLHATVAPVVDVPKSVPSAK